ncbi:hypothetical protein D3C86_1653120 [compost metagenome]
MAHNHDQFRSAYTYRVFQRSQYVFRHHITGNTYTEYIADTLVKQDLYRGTGIHTAKDRRKWFLLVAGFFYPA